MNPLGARDSPHPEIVELLTEETSRDTRPSTTEHRNPALGVPRFMRETAATMNRSRMDESHENSAPEQPSRATAPTSQTKETLERRASGLPRAHGKNNLFDRDVRIPGRYPSLGHTDSVQQPLDISDDSDDELPTTITTRKKGVAFIDHRADLSSPLGIRYPLMSEQRRYSRQSQAEVDTDYFSEAWLSPGPAASLEPLVEHAYERAQFERQPSTSYVIPREDNVTTFDLWENDAQGNPQRKDSLHTTPIGHTNNDQSKALNRLYDQIRDMWRDLGNERKHSDQLGEQLLARDKVIENLHSKDQETQDILEGYKGDAAPPEVHLGNDGVTEYVVSQVLDSRIRRNLVDPHTGERGLLQYKVEWVGDDQSEPWQPYHNLRSCKESVQDFHSRNPGRPGPHATFHDYDDDGQLAIALLQLLDSKYSNKFAPQSEL
ncbi:CHROMO domain containing protein [Pyrenophora tritici-repentis]|nr:CHROMO domain containing protein [Pyrenophora tritici-repentis]